MGVIKYVFEIDPVPQGRPRFARKGSYVQTYDPPKSKEFKNKLRGMAEKEFSKRPYQAEQYVPLKVTLKFYLPLLKSFSKLNLKKAIVGVLKPTKKPDLDNYLKGTLDALNGLFWHDDGQITDIVASKRYSEVPRIELIIEEEKE